MNAIVFLYICICMDMEFVMVSSLNAAKAVLIILWINAPKHKSLTLSLSLCLPLVEMSVLSPKWLRRSSMWCDRQPGSQPPISANGHDLFAGLGVVGCEARTILTGSFACLPSCRQEGELQGNRWDVMASVIPPSLIGRRCCAKWSSAGCGWTKSKAWKSSDVMSLSTQAELLLPYQRFGKLFVRTGRLHESQNHKYCIFVHLFLISAFVTTDNS